MSNARTSQANGIGQNEWLRLIVSSDLSATLKVVAHTLAFRADWESGKNIFPGQDRLQAEASLGRTALKSAIAKLISLELLERVSSGKSCGRAGGAQAAVYRLANPGPTFHGHLNEGHKATIICGHQCHEMAHEGHETTTINGSKGRETTSEGHDVANEGREVTPHPSDTLQVTLPPTPQPHRTISRLAATRRYGEDELILQYLRSQGINSDIVLAVLEYAKQDTTTKHSAQGRLKQREYLDRCVQEVKAARAKTYGAGAKCLDHPTEVARNCGFCNADWKCGQREARFIGKHQPLCSKCLEPLIRYPHGATVCHAHPEAVSERDSTDLGLIPERQHTARIPATAAGSEERRPTTSSPTPLQSASAPHDRDGGDS